MAAWICSDGNRDCLTLAKEMLAMTAPIAAEVVSRPNAHASSS